MKIGVHDFKLIWYFFRQYKIRALCVSLVMLISGFFELMNLAALYPVMNYGLKLESNNGVMQLFSALIHRFTSGNLFFASCVMLLVITFISMLFKLMYNFLSLKLMVKIAGDTQKAIFEKYTTADYDFYSRNKQGKLIHTGTIAPDHVTSIVLSTLRLSYDLISVLFLFSLLIALTWQGTCALLMVGIGYVLLVKRILGKIIYRCAVIGTEEDRKKNVILNEFINGIKAIKVFFTFDKWKRKYVNAVDRKLYYHFKMLMGRIFPEILMKLIFFSMLASVGIVLSQGSQGDIISAIPLFGTFAVVVNRFFPAMQMAGNDFMAIVSCLPNAKIVHEVCTTEHNAIRDGVKFFETFKRGINFRGVWFKYGNMEKYLLKGIDLTIKEKQVTAIVGPSGSGKTTIVNLLLKLYQPQKGRIDIDGTDIFEYSNISYLSKIGYVGQETFIFNDTIRENIRFGMEECDDNSIIEVAKLANAHKFITATENGYDTVMGDFGMKVSGGQRQRIAIARAMLRKPEILVLDEATSALDNISEKKIQDAIIGISKFTTILVIAHRFSTVYNADKIIVLNNGVISEEGTHKELIEYSGLYFDLYMRQQKIPA